MITARLVTKTGGPGLLIGLDHATIEQLRDNRPVTINLHTDVDPQMPDLTITLCAAENDGAIIRALADAMNGTKDFSTGRHRFTCPDCGAVSSSSPDDAANNYCGRCHEFKNPQQL